MGLPVGLPWFFDSKTGELVNSDIHITPEKMRGRKEGSHSPVRHHLTGHRRTQEVDLKPCFPG